MPKSNKYTGKWEVYLLFDPRNGKSMYVGCSECAEYRVAKHILRSWGSSTNLIKWLDELEALSLFPSWKVLEQGSGPDWAAAECKWIAYHRTLNADLLNATEGGAGARKVVSVATKAKMSASHIGKTHPGYFKGHKLSDSTKAAMTKGTKDYWAQRRSQNLGRSTPSRKLTEVEKERISERMRKWHGQRALIRAAGLDNTKSFGR